MQSQSRSSSPEKHLSPGLTEVFWTIVLKVIFPLAPFVVIFWVAALILNIEITGLYKGVTRATGPIALNLIEKNDQLSGDLVLRHRERYTIVDGKVTGDNKVEIHLQKEMSGEITSATAAPVKLLKPIRKSRLADDLGGVIQKADQNTGPEMVIYASKGQNELTGTLRYKGRDIKFTASRSAFSSLFGRRWINRALGTIGIKTSF